MSRLDIMTPSHAQTVIDGLYRDVERRIAASPPGLCPVDLAKSFLDLCHAQTCGKCVPCRIGLGQLSELMEQVLEGEATMETISIIERVARVIVNSADCAIGRDAARLVLDGVQGFRDDYEEHILRHRCLGGMREPVPCVALCPAGVDIPGYLVLIKYGRYADAVRLIRKDNPFPSACAYICEHPCEARCRRNMIDDAVNIRGLKRYAVDNAGYVPQPDCAEPTGKKVAVIGGGPSGLSAAYYLALMGHKVTVYEKCAKLGGMLRYGIPNYRLPDSVLDDFQYRHLELKGIKVRPNTTIGKTITIDDLFRDGYKSVFIGAGLWKANAMHIKGEALGNVAFGIDYLANSKAFRLGDDIAVIGVGNSAMDCARTAIRNGARHVTCYARRDESCISASEYEVSYAKLEGVGFRFCKAPVEIRENGLICRDTVKGEDGKFTQVEGSETFYPHTGVIVSVSQGSESNLVKTTTGIETNQKGLLTVSEDGSTTREGVFAGGDAVMGARTVVEAVAIAKQVAESMDKYMKSLPADTTPDPYADIPTFQTPTSDVLGKQEVK